MFGTKLARTLSVFNSSTRTWQPLALKRLWSPPTQTFSLLSWNIDAFSSRPIARSRFLLNQVLDVPKLPDVVFFQELTPKVRDSILNDARVRSAFLATNAEEYALEEGDGVARYTTMTLLSNERFACEIEKQGHVGTNRENKEAEISKACTIGPVSRIMLPSSYGREGLCVEFTNHGSPHSVIRLINVHLDSLWRTFDNRAQQVKILANVLREPGCGGGLIAGDFNAISPGDQKLVPDNGLEDAWLALHGDEDARGATWKVGAQRQDGLRPGRLDRVAMLGLKAKRMDILQAGHIDGIPWSDHCGLSCVFELP